MDFDAQQMYETSTLIVYILTTILYIISFIFKSIATYTLSKKNGFKHLYLAFIPFLNYILIGKLVGKIILWGQPIKNVGVWVCIVSSISFVVGAFLSLDTIMWVIVKVLELLNPGATVIVDTSFIDPIITAIYNNYILYYGLEIISMIASIAKIFFEVSLIFALFRKYKPQSYILFSILSIFMEFMFGFLLFSIRKNKPMTEEEYYREMAKKRGYYVYRVNPNDINNPYNPYAQQRPREKQKPTDDVDPFPEFSDKKGNGDNSSGDSSGDGLFD